MAHSKVSPTDTDRIVSLANGTGAYVCNSDGSSKRLATRSPAFTEAIAALVSEGLGKRISLQLDALAVNSPRSNWPEVLKNLKAAGILPA
jgi:hypothetical protein